MNDLYLHPELFHSHHKEHSNYKLSVTSKHDLLSRLWSQSIMVLIHPIHPPPAIFCVQIEHFQAAIREFSSICVSRCPFINQEKTTFHKLASKMSTILSGVSVIHLAETEVWKDPWSLMWYYIWVFWHLYFIQSYWDGNLSPFSVQLRLLILTHSFCMNNLVYLLHKHYYTSS